MMGQAAPIIPITSQLVDPFSAKLAVWEETFQSYMLIHEVHYSSGEIDPPEVLDSLHDRIMNELHLLLCIEPISEIGVLDMLKLLQHWFVQGNEDRLATGISTLSHVLPRLFGVDAIKPDRLPPNRRYDEWAPAI